MIHFLLWFWFELKKLWCLFLFIGLVWLVCWTRKIYSQLCIYYGISFEVVPIVNALLLPWGKLYFRMSRVKWFWLKKIMLRPLKIKSSFNCDKHLYVRICSNCKVINSWGDTQQCSNSNNMACNLFQLLLYQQLGWYTIVIWYV